MGLVSEVLLDHRTCCGDGFSTLFMIDCLVLCIPLRDQLDDLKVLSSNDWPENITVFDNAMTGSQNTRKHFDRTFQSKCKSSCMSKKQFYNLVSDWEHL